eukprot:TRINITY_DN5221_c0_g1_i1.p1 TRINITY_DN5221_c0_g1~~TRINITY_DN5221_c0_g1_i1.p1  ORF type:complete len:232 (-),score=48.65 TRINITY_DN5221_c0_g1_i1:159-854(-)
MEKSISDSDNFCIVILGSPASGKGTQAERIVSKYNIYHYSSGDHLRKEVKANSFLGSQIKKYMDTGELVPDSITYSIIFEALESPQCRKVILDGYPRTLQHAKWLSEMLGACGKKLVAAIYLEVAKEVLVERATGRRIHKPSGRVYHVKFKPPVTEGKDDLTGEPLMQREDDKEETVKRRIKIFHENAKPILDYYRKENVLYTINSDQTVDTVWKDIVTVLDGIFNSLKAS